MRYKQFVHIILSRTSGVPMYEQIVEQIRSAVYSGDLAPGDPLPSLRQLARDLEVSLITTTRAYNDLAAQGLIANQQGRGSFVLLQDPGATRARLNELLDRQTNELLATARLAGLNRESLLDRIDQQWKRTP